MVRPFLWLKKVLIFVRVVWCPSISTHRLMSTLVNIMAIFNQLNQYLRIFSSHYISEYYHILLSVEQGYLTIYTRAKMLKMGSDVKHPAWKDRYYNAIEDIFMC